MSFFAQNTLAQSPDFSNPQGVYNGDTIKSGTLENGAKVNQVFIDKMALTTAMEPRIIKVADGVWTFVGYHYVYATVIPD